MSNTRRQLGGRSPRGFTLVEAMVATTLLAVAGTAVVLAVASAQQSTHAGVEEAIAQGIAGQVLDEIAGKKYCGGSDPYEWPFTRTTADAAGPGRSQFDDVDDYAGLDEQPPRNAWGVPLGQDDGGAGLRHAAFRLPSGYFDNWRTEVRVYYVADSNLSTRATPGVTTNHRQVEVRVLNIDPVKGTRELARAVRVFAYVPHWGRVMSAPGSRIRRGLTLVELLVAGAIMAMLAVSAAALMSAVESGTEYGEGHGTAAQHARVVLDRIARTVREANSATDYPACVVISETVGLAEFPDVLAVWRPSSGTPTHALGPPLANELVIYTPAPANPENLLEVRAASGNATPLPAVSDVSGWRAIVKAILAAPDSRRTVLTDLLHVDEAHDTLPALPENGGRRGAVRFQSFLAPSAAEWSQYRGGARAWDALSWPQGVRSARTGLRQERVAIELMLSPARAADNRALAAQTPLPFFGTAARYTTLQP